MPFLLFLCFLLTLFNVHHWAYLPIYPDEITYQAFVSRAFFDDGQRTSFMAFCESSARIAIPHLFMPAAFLLGAYTWLDNMHVLRAVGIGFFLGSMVWAGFLLRPLLQTNTTRIAIIFWATALWVGVLPSVTFMLRAEHFIFLAALCALALVIGQGKQTKKAPSILFVLLPLLYSAALYTHPKAAFIAPALLAAVFFVLKAKPVFMGLIGVLIVAITGFGAHIQAWQLLHCPESPKLEALVNGFSINPLDVVRNPSGFFQAFTQNILTHDWLGAAHKMAFAATSDIGYLPPVDITRLDVVVANVLVLLSLAITFATACGFFIYHGALIVRCQASAPQMVLWLLQASVFVQMLLNRQTTFYDMGFWAAFSILVVVFSIAYLPVKQANTNTHGLIKIFIPFAAIHFVAALASAVAMHGTIYQAYIKGFPQHRISLVNYNFTVAKENTLKALDACALNKKMPQLVYDDYSYPFLTSSPHASAVTYLLLAAGDGETARAWLDKVKSSGIIAACAHVEKLKKPDEKMGQVGPLCCLKF